MLRRTLLALLVPAVLSSACRSSTPGTEVASDRYTLVHLKTGPRSGALSPEENARAFAGHFANMERMAFARQLVLAGPYGETRHDPALRGVFVLDTGDREEARAWAACDPTTQAGVFVQEFHDLRTAVPLEIVLEAGLARLERARAAGEEPQPGDGARPWVLLTAEHGDLAHAELDPLCTPEGGVFLLADLDQGRAWAVLDAANVAEARERFGPQLDAIGVHVLDDWFATDQLPMLVGG